MRRMGKLCVAVFIAVLLVQWCWAQEVQRQDRQWRDAGQALTEVTSVCLIEGDLPVVLAGARQGISRSEDAGVNWKQVLRVPGGAGRVYDIQNYGGHMYAATSAGVYYSADRGRQWKRLYRGNDDLSRRCYAVRANAAYVLAASAAGLLVSRDLGVSWKKASGVLGGVKVSALAQSAAQPQICAAAAGSSVYLSQDNGNSWEKVYALSGDGTQAEGEDEQAAVEETGGNDITSLFFDPRDTQRLYLSTARYVERSLDAGRSWQRLSDSGLLHKDIRAVRVVAGKVYAASAQSVCLFNDDSWTDISPGLTAGKIYALAADDSGRLYAGAEQGLFVAGTDDGAQGNRLEQSVSGEGIPDIRLLHKAAIDYAMVSAEKIADWHKRAGRRAWLPSVSFGLDRDTSELWHWEGGSTTRTTDDELRRGKETLDWDVSLSWDLADLVWSDDQTSIDTRSRLLVQLRNEILDELNKLYFEYLRTRAELADLPAADAGKIAAKKLRLAELAASLDALTHNKFSTAKPGIAVENSKE